MGNRLHDVDLSSDGRLAATDMDDGVRLWDIASGAVKGPPHRGQVFRAVAFSRDGRVVIAGSDDGTATILRVATDPASSELTLVAERTLQIGEKILSVAFSPDGRLAVTGGAGGEMQIWQTSDGTAISQRLRCSTEATLAAFSPDSRWLVTAGGNVAQLWEIPTNLVKQLIEEESVSKFVAFSSDGETILTGGRDRTQLWNANTGAVEASRTTGVSSIKEVRCVAFVNRQQLSVIADSLYPDVRIDMNALGGRLEPSLMLPEHHSLSAIDFSQDGTMAITGGTDIGTGAGVIQLWSVPSCKELPAIFFDNKAHRATLDDEANSETWTHAIAFAADGDRAISGHSSGKAIVWSIPSGVRDGTPLFFGGRIEAAAFSSDNKYIVTGGRSNNGASAQLWSVETREPLGQRLYFNHDRLYHVAFNLSSEMYVAVTGLLGGQAGAAQLVTLPWGGKVGPPFLHPDDVTDAVFDPGGMQLLTGCEDGVARIWRIPNPVTAEGEQLRLWIELLTRLTWNAQRVLERVSDNDWFRKWSEFRSRGVPPGR